MKIFRKSHWKIIVSTQLLLGILFPWGIHAQVLSPDFSTGLPHHPFAENIASIKKLPMIDKSKDFTPVPQSTTMGSVPPNTISKEVFTSNPPVPNFWNSKQRTWAGWGLVGGGGAVTIVTSILLGLALNDRLPLPGNCGIYTGVYLDPCIMDMDAPGSKAVFGISLTIGIASTATGLVFLLSPSK